MASSIKLLGPEVHEVQEEWSGQWGLRTTNITAKASQRDICFFRLVLPTELLKVMGLEGIHLPKALQWQSSLSFCLWCGKEGQNEEIVVNHLWTIHYHLGLICTSCLDLSQWPWMPCSDMLWYACQQQLVTATVMGESPHTTREMMMAMTTSNLGLMRTRLPHHLDIKSHHQQPNPTLQCPCQGWPFLPRPFSDSNCSM